ncbi:MAG: tRNA pseudouridine(55) synthase TruB [Clostridia bacterium]|nr:tRNA pseudouridine(55) synthase TruB [Clostridia bacterium]NCC44290.1 tRNA pseudouridine(55) synthase TruB [Clostridia bacterium]
MEINGVINVYKEAGYTSHDVVAKLRGIFHQKKIGHTGTLDPEAEGVLPVCLGKATRLCDMLADHDKVYEAVVRLGISTDTQDMTGKILQEKEVCVSEEEVRTCVASFEGEQLQIPPMYSAIKVNGKKLYELARQGKEVERKARKVHFYQIEILGMNLPEFTVRIHCSKGTYIRTLCNDIGEKLGCGGCMKQLTRTRVERFELLDARKLAQIEEYVSRGQFNCIVVPIDQMFEKYPKIKTIKMGDILVQNGNTFSEDFAEGDSSSIKEDAQVRIYDSEDEFVGIYKKKGEAYSPVKMFYINEGR